MNFDMESILARVPDYQEFYTVDELNRHSFQLAKEYPDVVELFEAGRSKEGRPIYCLKIGQGSKNALLYGTPHPNEPIGSMMLDALSRILAEDEQLRKALDYTFYIVKSSDVDGLAKNEGWLKGPFTITRYQHNFFRPAFDQQVEWSFPFDYKTYHFDAPTPETRCIMGLIDKTKPAFIYSLHNCGFGGCYWYLSSGDEELYKKFLTVPAKYGVDLNLGEPEMPYCKGLYDAVYEMTGAKDNYDYLEKFMPDTPTASLMSGGGCSYEYANRDGGSTQILVTEMPYYVDERVSDTSLTSRSRRQVILESCAVAQEYFSVWKPVFDRLEKFFSADNQFYLAVRERVGMESHSAAKMEWARSDPEMEKPATVCQEFDNLLATRFYSNLSIVLLRRACQEELKKPDLAPDVRGQLEKAADSLYNKECENLAAMEKLFHYKAIPIAHLVKVQLECGLLYADYVHGMN